MTLPKVELFCDGACLGNPGPGGWAYLLVTTRNKKRVEKLEAGADKHTTNNRMELRAAIEGLRALKTKCDVAAYLDSQYVIKGITEWLEGWRARGFKNAAKKPVANQELWLELDEVVRKHHVSWHWVKGHSGHIENERVDEAARLAAMQIKDAYL